MRVISSPSISTTGFLTLIFAIADEPLSCARCGGGRSSGRPAYGAAGALPARVKRGDMIPDGPRRAPLPQRRLCRRVIAWAAERADGLARRGEGDRFGGTCRHGAEIKGAYGRRRRALRQATARAGPGRLAGAARHGHATRWPRAASSCCASSATYDFFVDPADRVVGAWLMWHGEWQRHEIDQAVAVLAASGPAAGGRGVRRRRRQYRHPHGLCAQERPVRARGGVRAGAAQRAAPLPMNIEANGSLEHGHRRAESLPARRRHRCASSPPAQQGRARDRHAAVGRRPRAARRAGRARRGRARRARACRPRSSA